MERRRPSLIESSDIDPGDSFKVYLSEISRIPLLTEDEKHNLGKQIFQGNCAEHLIETGEFSRERKLVLTGYVALGEAAQKKMVKGHLRYAVGLVKKYKDRTNSIMELVCEANMGLVAAVKKYDYRKGAFTTYSRSRVTKNTTLTLLAEGRDMVLPQDILTRRIRKVYSAIDTLKKSTGRAPSIDEIAGYLDVSPSKIKDLLVVSKYPISFSNPIEKGRNLVLEDKIRDPSPSVESQVEERILAAELVPVVADVVEKELTAREERVVKLYYGFGNRDPMTLEDAGKIMDVTRSRIHELKHSSFSKLNRSGSRKRLAKVK